MLNGVNFIPVWYIFMKGEGHGPIFYGGGESAGFAENVRGLKGRFRIYGWGSEVFREAWFFHLSTGGIFFTHLQWGPSVLPNREGLVFSRHFFS